MQTKLRTRTALLLGFAAAMTTLVGCAAPTPEVSTTGGTVYYKGPLRRVAQMRTQRPFPGHAAPRR